MSTSRIVLYTTGALVVAAVAAQWDAVVVLHTWEMGKAPAPVRAFLERTRSSPNLVVMATSGGGDAHIEGVDVISAASRMSDVDTRVGQIQMQLDRLLESHAR